MPAWTQAVETMPIATVRNGRQGWLIGARFIPVMAGGEGEDDPKGGDPPKGDDDPPKGDDDDFDKDRALATIRKLREQEKALKAQVKDTESLKARLQEIEDKDKSETERQASRAQEALAKLTAAEQRAQDLALQMAVERAARKLRFIDEDDAYRLIDRRAVQVGDDGEPTNVDALLKDLAKAKPHLVAAEDDGQKPNGGGTRAIPPTPKPAGRQPTRDELVKEHEEKLAGTGLFGRL